jgi:hypothetical protein
MTSLKHNFSKFGLGLSAVLVLLTTLSATHARRASAASDARVEMPVSINAIMVTLIDHSAHHIWDYSAMQRDIRDDEWLIVEYYAIQLAAAGPALTLGGTGAMDGVWVDSEQWADYARTMSNAGMQALVAAQDHDKARLFEAGSVLTDSCEGCHELFKPDLPTEGITHLPDYDLIYHVFGPRD